MFGLYNLKPSSVNTAQQLQYLRVFYCSILVHEAADTLLAWLGKELFPLYGMIARESDGRVLRAEKC